MPSTGKIGKQATAIQTHKYKTDIKAGTWNTQKGQPALWQYCQLSGGGATEADTWRTGTSTGDGGEKRVERPEVRTGSCGILQSGWLDAELGGGEGAKEIRPTASAGPKLMRVFAAFTERKRYTGDSVSDGETWVTHPVTAAPTRLRESGFLSLNRYQRLRGGWTTRFLGIVSGAGRLFHRDGGSRRRI